MQAADGEGLAWCPGGSMVGATLSIKGVAAGASIQHGLAIHRKPVASMLPCCVASFCAGLGVDKPSYGVIPRESGDGRWKVDHPGLG